MRIVLCSILVLTVPVCAAGAVIHVHPDGADAPGGGSPDNPLRTIQYALDQTSNGDTVMIHPGTYTGPGNYDLTPRGRDLHIRSIDPNDPHVIASTVINPAAAGRGFAFADGESAACILEGLKITAGLAGRGGAMRCDNSSPTIVRCAFIANTATLQGGAIYLYNSNASVRQSVIAHNTASTDGGGIESWYGSITLANCLIYGNTANSGQGGGLDVFNSPSSAIVNCTIADNQAFSGGAIYLWNSSAAVENCILWSNAAQENDQIGLHPASVISIAWSNVQGGYAGEGNIDSDPLFAGPQDSQSEFDYHLMSEWGRRDVESGLWVHDSATSPCIDAANPAANYDAEPWPHGGRANMGAFGATAQASMNGSPADFNIDGRVDWRDLAEFAENWLAESAGIYNLDGQGRVDMTDAAIFMKHWGWAR